jgi:8-oxo-dGTP diphosphatase
MQKGVDHIGVSVVYFCHDGEGNVFMGKRGHKARDEQGKWDIGGGGVEFGDTAVETLQKEIREEYGTDILDYEFLGYRDVHREHTGNKTHWITLDFKVLVDKEKAKNNEPHKFDDARWFTIETLPIPIHSQLPIFLEKYKNKL